MATTIRARMLRMLAIGGIVAATMMPSPVFGQDVGTYGGGNDTTGSDSGDPGAQPTETESQPRSGGSLPLTGGDIVGLTLIGAGALAGGTVLVRSGRRRTVDA